MRRILFLNWVAFLFVCAFSSPPTFAQTGEDLQALRKDVEALKTGQKEMQKSLQIIKDLLMGKQPPLEDVFITTDGAQALGEKTAKVTMVEFSDYQCPFCRKYATETLSQVIDAYVRTGKVRYVFRNFPLEALHPLAEKAAEAAQCAGEQGKYWEAHDRFFRNQQALDAHGMKSHARELGLDPAKFEECLESGKYAALVKADLAEGQKYGVRGTPTFFFGTESKGSKLNAVKVLSGAEPFSSFKEIIDNLLSPPGETSQN